MCDTEDGMDRMRIGYVYGRGRQSDLYRPPVNLPVFVYGASMGWMSPMTLLLQSKNSPAGVPLSDTEIGWIASVSYLSAAISIYFLALVGDKMGRKITLICVSFIGTVSWILMLCALSTWAIIVARVIVGITLVGSYVTCPVYTREISSDNIRGALGCLTMIFHTSGILFLYVIGDLLEYRTILWICLAIPLVHILLFMSMPESPSFLVKDGKIEEATKVLLWLRCKRVTDCFIEEELHRILIEQKNDEMSKRSGFRAIWDDKILSKAFIIILMLVLARDLCGAVTFMSFAGEIFSISSAGTGIVPSPNQQAMILGCVQVVASVVAATMIERVGRKILLSSTACITGISMLLLASWFLAKELQVTLSSWIPVVTLCICIFCDSAGLLPVSCVLSNELFSFQYRSIVLAITLGIADVIDFLQLIFFKPMIKNLGIYVMFYSFGIICLSCALYVIIILPETKGRSLQEIYKDLYKDNKSCSVL